MLDDRVILLQVAYRGGSGATFGRSSWCSATGDCACRGACSSGRGSSSPATSATPTTAVVGSSQTTTAANGVTFGDLPSPCGPGDATGATDQGVTNTGIHIAYGDDRGYAASPGLDQEMGDAAKAMIKWCNDQGGINGRQIVGDYYDAAITQVNTSCSRRARPTSCWSARAGPWTRPPSRRGSAATWWLFPGSPSDRTSPTGRRCTSRSRTPSTTFHASVFYEMAKLFPQDISKFDFLHTTLASATEIVIDKELQAPAAAGYHMLNCGVTHQLQRRARLQAVRPEVRVVRRQADLHQPECRSAAGQHDPGHEPARRQPDLHGRGQRVLLQPLLLEHRGMGNNIYIRRPSSPWRTPHIVPAVQQYINIVKAIGRQDQPAR